MNLLAGGEVRVFNRVLADRLGDREAMFLGQLHFWITHGHPVERDGRRWIRKSAKEWHERDFSFWSERTVVRIIARLEAEGVLLSVPGTMTNQRKLYTINYEHEAVAGPPDKMSDPLRQNGGGSHDKVAVLHIEDQEDHLTGSTPKVADVDISPGFDREQELALVRGKPTHGPTISRFWRRCMSEYGHTNATQPGMKVKDQKILKDILKLLPEGGERMLLNVLEHYALFVNFAREGYNVNLAAKPQVQKLMLVVDGIAEFDTPAMNDDTDYSTLGLQGLEDDDSSNANDT